MNDFLKNEFASTAEQKNSVCGIDGVGEQAAITHLLPPTCVRLSWEGFQHHTCDPVPVELSRSRLFRRQAESIAGVQQLQRPRSRSSARIRSMPQKALALACATLGFAFAGPAHDTTLDSHVKGRLKSCAGELATKLAHESFRIIKHQLA